MSEERTEETRREKTIDIDSVFGDVLKGLKKFWIIGLAVFILFAGFFCIHAKRHYVPIYSSKASFAISVSNSYGVNNKYYNTATADQMAKTFPYILQSGVLVNFIKDDLDMQAMPCSITASSTEGINLFEMTVTAADPELAYKVLQSAVKNYPKVADYVVGPTVLTKISETGVADKPINKVSYKRQILKGFLIGLVVLAVMVIAYAVTRSTVKKTEDIKKILNTRCIGTVPQVIRKKRSVAQNTPLLLTSKNVDYGFRESFRLLRTRIEREEDKKIILITSALAHEGKTTISVNLAISLAMKGKKVLLIDCDLNNPSAARYLGIKDNIQKGLIDYLEGDAGLDEVGIRLPKYGDLLVIGNKERRNKASEILDNGRLENLINSLKDYVDYIILDASPSAVLTDSTILSRLADGVLYVIKQDYADSDSIINGVENLSAGNAPIIGCVLNNVEKIFSKYNHSYDYGYSYGYNKKYSKYYGNH